MRRAPLVVLALLLTGCGSTVQTTKTVSAPTVDGLGAPVPQTSSAPAAGAPGGGQVTTPGVTNPVGGPAVPGTAPSGPAVVVPGGGGVAGTDTSPVEVGLFVSKDLGAAAKAIGYDGLSTGDGKRQAELSVALLNRRGGLAGHRVVPVVFEYDVTQDANTQFQAACSTFFDDHKVKAVVSGILQPVIEACATRKGIPFFSSGNRTTSTNEMARYPLLVNGATPSLERVVPLQVASLHQQGWFTKTSKVGLIYNEDPDFAAVPGQVENALKAAGLPPLVDKQPMPGVDDTSRVGSASTAGQNAALRFSTRGIDRVLVVDKSGQALAYFAIGAQNQSYYPAYGISSLELPNVLRTVLSARQVENARGIGWAPTVDQNVRDQKPTSTNTTACLQVLTKAGEDMTLAATRESALATCDGVLLLGAAAQDPSLTGQSVLAGLRALGRGYQSVLTFATDFSRRPDGVSVVRPIAYQSACDCFAYVGPQQAA